MFSAFTLHFKGGFYFLCGISCIKIVTKISNRSHINVCLYCGVHIVIDSDKTGTNSNTTTSSGTASGTDGGNTNRYGFNSNSAVGERTDSRTSSSSTSSTVGVSETSSDTDDTTISDNEDKKLIRRKHGNIGVTENVTMLEHETEFWHKWSFIDAICLDICDIIALSIY